MKATFHISDVEPEQVVVIVKSNYEEGFTGLKDKRYCHPGFRNVDILTPLFLQAFESKVLEANTIDICINSTITLVEKNIQALSVFFGPSCRPGPWTVDTHLNSELSKYQCMIMYRTKSAGHVNSV